MSEVTVKAQQARQASFAMATVSAEVRNNALYAMADILELRSQEILGANGMDVTAASAKGTPAPLIDRLLLTTERIFSIAAALRVIAGLPDPLSEVVEGRRLKSGIDLKRITVPLGVVAMVYEARPNVTVDAAALCVKTGNVCILRGGSMAINSVISITNLLYEAALSSGLPPHCIQAIVSTSREATYELMGLHGLIDVLIPRGSKSLIQSCVEHANVPIIETGTGNCHLYVHEDADIDMALAILINAKCQRPGVCNAIETLLVDSVIAEKFLPVAFAQLGEQGVELRCDQTSQMIADFGGFSASSATKEDWAHEYVDLILSVRVVSDIDEAISHIRTYGTQHSEAIVSENYSAVERFLNEVDAAAVYANASTRFTDGEEFGLGAEIGISTQKLHARGPMGLSALTSTKCILTGTGQVR